VALGQVFVSPDDGARQWQMRRIAGCRFVLQARLKE